MRRTAIALGILQADRGTDPIALMLSQTWWKFEAV
jgi:hypothetical protein